MSKIQVRYLSEEECNLWDRFVSANPSASIFDGTDYLVTVCNALKCNLKILAVFSGDEIIGGVTFNISKRFGKSTAGRIPLCPTNSCIISPLPTKFPAKETRHILEITNAIAEFLESNFDYVVITNNHHLVDIRSFAWRDWRTLVQYTYHVDLRAVDISNIPSNRRNKIVNAKKAGIVVEEMDKPDMAYELLEKTYSRKGKSPPVTFEQFFRIYSMLGREKIIFLFAKPVDSERATAVNISVIDTKRKIGYSLLRGFNPEYKDTNASSLLQLREIEHLQGKGFLTLDLVGAENQSIALFKSEFGGKLIPYYHVWYASNGYRILNLISMINPFRRGNFRN